MKTNANNVVSMHNKMAVSRIVVVGNGMVGHYYVEKLALMPGKFDITVIGAETRPAYDRVHLSEIFAGKKPEDLALTSRSAYEELGIKAIFGDEVVSIDRQYKSVTTATGRRFEYDKLVLATGSYPFVPPIPGADNKYCLVYRTIDDLGMIKAKAQQARKAVVVGGGLLGLECANALRNLGLETHIVEFAKGLMSVQLDARGSELLQRMIADLDVRIHTGKATQRIIAGQQSALRMEFAEEEDYLETDLIVFSAGIRPQDKLARDADLAVGPKGGILIDQRCRTSDNDIYAIGECALSNNRIYGLVAPGYRMADTALSQFTDKPVYFAGADMSTKLKLLGVDVGSIGDAHGSKPGSLCFQYVNEARRVYKRLNVSTDGKHLLGAVLVGDCSDYDSLLQYYLNEIELPENPDALILPGNTDTPLLSASGLPMTATICSCHNVKKSFIIDVMDKGCMSLAEVKAETAASTGCGGCAALLKSVVDDELSARGMEVNNHICGHFAFSRQELFHLCQVEVIRDFNTLLARHGKGRGCDICKPAVASILASLWNDYVLKDAHVPLQDTNDTFLANMQKDGTYSVVPRIAGGEITPEKLRVIAEVAHKHDLYTKITGGQRIDMFGARLEQLPEIWTELVQAGFETGHAYGKALRTVKSCVGSSWCRYGVQDSVGMAILIENRYKGLRAPHKIKSAVSGCTRECAEAQSKDFGVIATENGWNLYVCGNGGMRPRHADLFATDLDDETLIRYIDRFLMFYVKTADRLQRTSVWMDNLEGGLDYLKEVVIDDKLGIGKQLEAQMAALVGSYQCEWKTTIEDPEKLKRFRQFVNSDSPDEQVIFVRERNQKRPATEAERGQIVLSS